jgi:hypothetical protein
MREDTRTGGHEGRIGQLEAWRLRGLVDQKAATIQVAGGGRHFQVSGLGCSGIGCGSQVSAVGYRVRAFRFGYGYGCGCGS